MKISLTLLALATLGVCGCSIPRQRGYVLRPGVVHFAKLDEVSSDAEGLFLTNLQEMTPERPSLVITNVSTNFTITVALVNGYSTEMILRTQDEINFCITNVVCRGSNHAIMAELEDLPGWYSFPYHLKYENLREPHNTTNAGRVPCGCAMTTWKKTLSLKRYPDKGFDDDMPPLSYLRGGPSTVPIPQGSHSLDVRGLLTLRYLLNDRPAEFLARVPFWVRVKLNDTEGQQPAAQVQSEGAPSD